MNAKIEQRLVKLDVPEGTNIIIGQSHFIKTVEDIYEAIVNTSGNIKFGLAFNEASGPCLVRKEGNDEELINLAVNAAQKIGAGHCFVIYIKEGFPINILPSLKEVREVLNILCATANPVEVIVFETEQGRAIAGIVDGFSPKGVETDKDIEERKSLLRKFGYKR